MNPGPAHDEPSASPRSSRFYSCKLRLPPQQHRPCTCLVPGDFIRALSDTSMDIGTVDYAQDFDAAEHRCRHTGGVRRVLIFLAVTVAVLLAGSSPAQAHQPVRLTAANSTADRGPLLVDGTVSFAVYATVKGQQTRGFRFGLRSGQRLETQLLIVDKAPGNALAATALPEVVITDPRGNRTILTPDERSPFLEPYSGTKYLYLARLSGVGVGGTYQVLVRSRSTRPVEAVVAVGFREVPGSVVR